MFISFVYKKDIIPLTIIKNDRITTPLIDRIANIEIVISKMAIRKSKKSFEKIEENKLQAPLMSIAKNNGKK
jgi:hypothetical protein